MFIVTSESSFSCCSSFANLVLLWHSSRSAHPWHPFKPQQLRFWPSTHLKWMQHYFFNAIKCYCWLRFLCVAKNISVFSIVLRIFNISLKETSRLQFQSRTYQGSNLVIPCKSSINYVTKFQTMLDLPHIIVMLFITKAKVVTKSQTPLKTMTSFMDDLIYQPQEIQQVCGQFDQHFMSAFAPIFLCQKSQTLNVSSKKFSAKLLYEKAEYKMLVKLTPGYATNRVK